MNPEKEEEEAEPRRRGCHYCRTAVVENCQSHLGYLLLLLHDCIAGTRSPDHQPDRL